MNPHPAGEAGIESIMASKSKKSLTATLSPEDAAVLAQLREGKITPANAAMMLKVNIDDVEAFAADHAGEAPTPTDPGLRVSIGELVQAQDPLDDLGPLEAIPAPALTPEKELLIRALYRADREIEAIRVYRAATAATLAEARNDVVELAANGEVPEDYVLPPAEEAPDFLGGAAEPPKEPDPRDDEPRLAFAMATGQRLVHNRIREVKIPLSDAELLAKGAELARYEQERDQMLARHKGVRAELLEEKADMQGKIALVAGVIRDGEEIRSCRVAMIADYDAGDVIECLEDGREISRRPLNPAERQLDLFPAPADAPEGPKYVAPTASDEDKESDEDGDGDDEGGEDMP